jgi:death on curing protein
MQGPIFLSLMQVLRMHASQLDKFGGSAGVRDLTLIESAISQPQQSFGGVFVHADLPDMAAAYLFHLAKNHGFVDGNKRIAAAAALTFLEFSGVDTNFFDDEKMESLVWSIAEGTADKAAAAAFFRAQIGLKD